ncbi:hypothetical protein JW960_04600 [candidate division KSB1 bacterium]|nr:hypothetical protein [candidate division KSB1 bacterium]
MSTILVISKNNEIRRKYRSAFYKMANKIIVKEDIFEGMNEIKWYSPDLIIWNFDPQNSTDKKGYTNLRTKYGSIPIILAINEYSQSDTFEQYDSIIYGINEIEKMKTKIVEIIGKPKPIMRYLDDETEEYDRSS